MNCVMNRSSLTAQIQSDISKTHEHSFTNPTCTAREHQKQNSHDMQLKCLSFPEDKPEAKVATKQSGMENGQHYRPDTVSGFHIFVYS